jgi:hypothetical protein
MRKILGPKSPPRAIGQASEKKRYSAVSIVTKGECCAAVKSLIGSKRLALEMRGLPLDDCSMRHQCQCRFQKHSDRRSDDEGRRLAGVWVRSVWYEGTQRRKARGRRADD